MSPLFLSLPLLLLCCCWSYRHMFPVFGVLLSLGGRSNECFSFLPFFTPHSPPSSLVMLLFLNFYFFSFSKRICELLKFTSFSLALLPLARQTQLVADSACFVPSTTFPLLLAFGTPSEEVILHLGRGGGGGGCWGGGVGGGVANAGGVRWAISTSFLALCRCW